MKIVMLCDFYGINLTYQENLLSKYYSYLGHEVVIITSTIESIFEFTSNKFDAKQKEKIVFEDDIKIIRLPYKFNLLNKLRKHAGVLSLLQQEKPNLIFVHGIHLNLKEAVTYKKMSSGCKIILDYHADYNNSANNWASLNILHRIIRKTFFHKYLKYIDRIYPITPSCQQFLYEVYNVDYNLMEVLPLGCDYIKSTEIMNKVNTAKIKNELGIPNESFVIITGGKLNSAKKTDILLDSLNKIDDKNIHLIIFGKADKNEEKYEETLKLKSKGLNVHFTGWIESDIILKLMSISDIAVFLDSPSVLWQQSIGMHLPLILGDSGHNCVEYLNLKENIINLKNNISAINVANHLIRIKKDISVLNRMKEGAKIVGNEYLDYRIICNRTLRVVD
jgi:glycosyltransferase involved in cell wall biosynthesis